MPQRSKQTFRGIDFLESVYPTWSPASQSGGNPFGRVIWEIEPNLPGLFWDYDPSEPESLEEARDKIKEFLTRVMPADQPR